MTKKKEEGSSRGRPSLYRQEFVVQAEKLCLLGATDSDLAEFFEVAESTINLWKHEHPEFMESIKRGKMLADAQVAERLFQRATGYMCDDVHVSVIKEKVVLTKLKKHYPPDTTAAIFWLKNRQPVKWRDRQEIRIGRTLEDILTEAGNMSE